MNIQGTDLELDVGDTVFLVFYNYAKVTMKRMKDSSFEVFYGIEGKKKLHAKNETEMQSALDVFDQKNGKLQKVMISRSSGSDFKEHAEHLLEKQPTKK